MIALTTAANDNRNPVQPAGCSYYPEMGERPPVEALITADLAHYGRHYYLKFAEKNREPVMAAIKKAKIRFSDEDKFESCITGEALVTVWVTVKAYRQLRQTAPAICTSAILLD